MKYEPERHHQRSISLKGYDYSQPWVYFVTIFDPGFVPVSLRRDRWMARCE